MSSCHHHDHFCWSYVYLVWGFLTANTDIKPIISTDQNTTAFKEVAIIHHPRVGEYAFGFITSTVILQVFALQWWSSLAKESFFSFCACISREHPISSYQESLSEFLNFDSRGYLLQRDNEDEELCSVFVPTNHLYIGDIFLVNSKDIIRPNLSIREGIGMCGIWNSHILLCCWGNMDFCLLGSLNM